MVHPSSCLPSLLLVTLASFLLRSEASCRKGCDLALGAYYVSPQDNLTYISSLFNLEYVDLGPYNPEVTNLNSIGTGSRVHVFFRCDCIDGDFLGHNFSYVVLGGDSYEKISENVYANLTTAASLTQFNSYPMNNVPEGKTINVTVNCSCGDSSVSKNYGLFETYPLRPEDNLWSLAEAYGFSGREDLLQAYNPGINFSAGMGIAFIPTKDPSGGYRALSSSAGISSGAIAGISVAGVTILICTIYLYIYCQRRMKAKKDSLLSSTLEVSMYGPGMTAPREDGNSIFVGITVDKSVEFTYEELARATDDFSLAYKIGSGGFGIVYYAELRGEKAAIKKMDMQATNEFLAELKVLTNVHHLNLVRLIGYCTEVSLFLVYEFIDNGNLSEHLRGLGRDPLAWVTRVQVALDSARGLEYIHEHTVPVYIHRDIKSANILLDKKFRAKVADFGLAKLTEVGSSSQTRLVGTFGYMPPEYAQYGDISPKVDVYAFGVVLFELISAKDAIVKTGGSLTESKGLIALFEGALSKSDPKEDLKELVDPRLGQDYPIDSVLAMALLAKSCTRENPQLRPTMRQVVVTLMTLSSATEDWDMGTFYENQALTGLMSGR
ncbi:chitin elicitor receptor kinase 1-like isoform X1 [Zingiber officinale]|uniref:non-specific serine/threonine protein kinase n=1 Tax=Zingiber officinale TaxID=94328 RepID=A0A8J5GJ42_ZINOF|nr:chitin elicitor receptor kinase 1-like isoform X1 [Zingiber officinale]KAG6507166.1 hypothetical protein ZIOFF_032507 [Zingiber officinale]